MEGWEVLGDHLHCSEDKLLEDILDPLDSVAQDSGENVVVQRAHCFALQDSSD